MDVNTKALCIMLEFIFPYASCPLYSFSSAIFLSQSSHMFVGGAYFRCDFSTLLPKVINLTLNCPYKAEIRERDWMPNTRSMANGRGMSSALFLPLERCLQQSSILQRRFSIYCSPNALFYYILKLLFVAVASVMYSY